MHTLGICPNCKRPIFMTDAVKGTQNFTCSYCHLVINLAYYTIRKDAEHYITIVDGKVIYSPKLYEKLL